MTALEIVDHRRVWHEPNGYLVGDRYLCADCAYWREALALGDGRVEVLATWREAYADYLDDDN